MGKRNRRGLALFSLTSSGNSFVLTFILLVIISSFLLVRGFFPKSTLTDPRDNAQYELGDQEQNDSATGLQLRTLKLKQCQNAAAVDMLLDRSGSMQGNKLKQLKEAANGFVTNLTDDSIIGIQSFSSSSQLELQLADNVPISPYGSVKPLVASAINGLNAGGGTPTKSALEFSRQKLAEAIPKYPGKNFVLIFVSDGQPTPQDQNPITNPPNPADGIKSLGVTIYTIAIGADSLNNVMSGIASGPDTMFNAPTGTELKGIYDKIATRLCNKTN